MLENKLLQFYFYFVQYNYFRGLGEVFENAYTTSSSQYLYTKKYALIKALNNFHVKFR